MPNKNVNAMATLLLLTLVLTACNRHESSGIEVQANNGPSDDKVVNLFIWSDYLAPDTVATFEKQSGVKVQVSYFDTNATLETRILTGNSGFDVVVPSGAYFQRLKRSGAFET